MSNSKKFWELKARYRFGYPVFAVGALAIAGKFASYGPPLLFTVWLGASAIAFFVVAISFAGIAWAAWTFKDDDLK